MSTLPSLHSHMLNMNTVGKTPFVLQPPAAWMWPRIGVCFFHLCLQVKEIITVVSTGSHLLHAVRVELLVTSSSVFVRFYSFLFTQNQWKSNVCLGWSWKRFLGVNLREKSFHIRMTDSFEEDAFVGWTRGSLS